MSNIGTLMSGQFPGVVGRKDPSSNRIAGGFGAQGEVFFGRMTVCRWAYEESGWKLEAALIAEVKNISRSWSNLQPFVN
jgi:hypothetical protein